MIVRFFRAGADLRVSALGATLLLRLRARLGAGESDDMIPPVFVSRVSAAISLCSLQARDRWERNSGGLLCLVARGYLLALAHLCHPTPRSSASNKREVVKHETVKQNMTSPMIHVTPRTCS